jgi:hypothetical protein
MANLFLAIGFLSYLAIRHCNAAKRTIQSGESRSGISRTDKPDEYWLEVSADIF